jgi:hypothetical protein
MTDHVATDIPEDRPLSEAERGLVKWLLQHGNSEAHELLPQLERARVVSRCSCGCASVDFSIGGEVLAPRSGMSVVSDYRWDSPEGYLFGVFAYSRGGLLSGIDLWSIDGRSTASTLPNTDQLRPIDK